MRLVHPSTPPSDSPSSSTLVEMIWPGQLDLDAHQGDRVVGDELPDHDRCRDKRSGRHQDPVVGPTRKGECERLESSAKRSTMAGRSITKKSVPEGSPLGPRSAPSCSSRSSKKLDSTRTCRRRLTSAPTGCPRWPQCAPQSCAACAQPGQGTRSRDPCRNQPARSHRARWGSSSRALPLSRSSWSPQLVPEGYDAAARSGGASGVARLMHDQQPAPGRRPELPGQRAAGRPA